jgi:hypothetical protein
LSADAARAALIRLTIGACRAILAGMEWALGIAGIIGLIAAVWLLATGRSPPVEMPGGETIIGAPRQPERPLPHRPVEE